MASLDLIDWPADRTVAVSGSPAGLRLPLVLRNATPGVVHVAEVSLADVRRVGGGPPLRLDPVPIAINIAADGVARTQLRLRLDPATPPGRYEGRIALGDQSRTVAIEVLAEAKLSVRPEPLVVDVAAGLKQLLMVSAENRGNIPLTIDLAGDYSVGEEVPIAQGPAVSGRTADRLAALLDQITGRGAAPTLVSFGTAQLDQPGGARVVAPGEAQVVAVTLALPKGLAPSARYHLFAPLYAASLHLVIVTAAKTTATAVTPKRTKGAVA